MVVIVRTSKDKAVKSLYLTSTGTNKIETRISLKNPTKISNNVKVPHKFCNLMIFGSICQQKIQISVNFYRGFNLKIKYDCLYPAIDAFYTHFRAYIIWKYFGIILRTTWNYLLNSIWLPSDNYFHNFLGWPIELIQTQGVTISSKYIY